MGKFGKKVEINLDPLSYNIGLLGESGIGKSTIIKQVCEKLAGEDGYISLDIGKEDGHKAISGIVSEKVPNWKKFIEIKDDIIENKDTDYPNLKVIVYDTYDEFCNIAEQEAIRLWNKENPDKRAKTINSAWGGFGKGLDKTVDLMLNALWELKEVGVNFIYTAHTKKKDIDDVTTEEQYSILTSNVSQKYFNAIKTKTDFLGLAYIDREIVKEKTNKKDYVTKKAIEKNRIVSESRVINFRDDTYSVDSKSRFAEIVDQVPFDCDCFIKAMKDSILEEQKKDGTTIADAKKKQAAEKKIAEKKASEVSKDKRENKIDEDANEELISIIKTKFVVADDDVKTTIKEYMAQNNIKNFKDINIPTKHLEYIVSLLK